MKKLFVDTGFRIEGYVILAYKNCKCGGRGHVGRNILRDEYIACRCIIKTQYQISFVYL